MPYFTQPGLATDPDIRELHNFMNGARRFLHDLLTDQLRLAHPRPATAPALFLELRQEALAVYLEYVHDRFEQLHYELDRVDQNTLVAHGLIGECLHEKLRTLAELEVSGGDEASYWPRIGKMLQELDATLDAVLDPLKIAAPRVDGFIGLFKEFRAPVLNLVNG